MNTRRLRVAPWTGGGLQAADTATGRAVFAAPMPLMWDSTRPAKASAAGDPTDGPLDGAKVAGIKTSATAGQLTLQPDPNLLTGADVRFPVYIDPAWRTEKDTSGGAWAMVSSGFPGTSYYKFSGKSTEGVGFCDVSRDGNCVKNQVKRLFYRIPSSYFAGKTILSATFTGNETYAYDCGNDTVVQLWLTKAFGSSSTWNSTDDNWLQHLDSRDVSYCSSTPVEFDATSAVKQSASKGWSTITFGLRAYSESSMSWWKRFADDASLRVNYNSPPPQPKMSQLTMSPGGACVLSPRPYVNEPPKIYATNLTDPDGDKVYAEFEASWDDGTGCGPKWSSGRIGPKASGTNVFSTQLPSSIPQNTSIEWHVRTYDGAAYSPWSWVGSATGCYFTYDATAPDGPAIASADGRYPQSDPENENDPWNDGVGRYGAFTLDSTATDVVKYQYAVNGGPTQTVNTSAGAPVTINVMPSTSGLVVLTAQAFDAAGHPSESETYYFRARAGDSAKTTWSLDETSGIGVTGKSVDVVADVHGGVTLGAAGVDGSAMTLDGTGYAATAGPVLDTTNSFAVSAWVKLASKSGVPVVVSQEGSFGSSFALYYQSSSDRWEFNMQTPDDSPWTAVVALSKSSPTLNRWTHLVGVYDSASKSIGLYVDGVLQQTLAQPNIWRSSGPLNIGRYKVLGGYQDQYYFNGSIDDVKVFDRVVSGSEVTDLFDQHPVVVGRWKLNTDGSDDTAANHPLTFSGDAHVDQAAGIVGDPMGGLVLDGAGDCAVTSGPVVPTDQSFTVAGWVQTATAPTGNAAFFSQEGDVNSGFTVRYSPTAVSATQGGYQVEIPSQDAAGATLQQAGHSGFHSLLDWDHVAIVYDAFQDKVTLYVNGSVEAVADTDQVSYRFNTRGFNATKGFHLGCTKSAGLLGEYWPGVIDDVWAFSGVLGEDQIQTLAGYGEELPTTSSP